MIDKNKMPLAVGVAFVGFTTQFGGGFASGAQLYQYFINYGVWTLIIPVLSQFLLALFFWYGMRWAYRGQVYDYRGFSNHFYGKYKVVFSNLYELVYFIMVCLAPAVAFATGASTLTQLTKIPYWLCTVLIGVFIFVITLYGTELVRKCAATLSVLIIVGLLVVLIPNIIVQWDAITQSVSRLAAGETPVGSAASGSFLSALWSGIVYFLFQLTAVGLMYQHVKPLTDEKQIKVSMVYMFIVSTVAVMLSVIGLLAIAFDPDLTQSPIPILLFVQNGVGAAFLTPVISILIILGAVSTGVNMIAGIVYRVVSAMERKESSTAADHKRHARNFAASLGFTLLAFFIAQFGLIPLVKVGYSYLGYATMIVVAIPFIFSMAVKRK